MTAGDGGGPDAGAPLDGQPPASRGMVGHIAWEATGEGSGVPLVALHGVTDSGACWGPLMPHWARSRTVVTIDAPGHGRSGLSHGPFTIAVLAADTAAVIREVLGTPAVVLGHSLGGLTAQELALGCPELVAALVLEDPAWRRDRDVDSDGVPHWLHSFVRSFAGASRGQLESRSRVENPHWPDDEHGPWAASKRQLDQGLVDVPHVWDARDWVESLASVQAPVTLITGEPGRGAIVDQDQVERAAAILGPRLTHVPIAGAGHSIRRDQRGPFLATVERALAEADARAGG